MIRIILTSIFLLFAIIWGVYPYTEHSPLNKLMVFFNIEYKITKTQHMLLGTILYIIGICIAQMDSITRFWY